MIKNIHFIIKAFKIIAKTGVDPYICPTSQNTML